MSAGHILEARLVVEPVAAPAAFIGRLRWEVAIDHGIAAAGPAGAAAFHLPDGSTVWSDYSDPSRLLQVEIPAGTIDDPYPESPVAEHQELDAAHLALVEVLLGPRVASMLRSAATDEITDYVEALASWPTAGRIALGHQLLADRDQPIAGIWAMELAQLLADLGGGPLCGAYRQQLLATAEPSALLLPASLADKAVDVAAPLGHLLSVTARREGRSFGPLGEELARRNADAVIAEALRAMADVVPEGTGPRRRAEPPVLVGDSPVFMGGASPVFRGSRAPKFRGAGGSPGTVVAMLVDHSVSDLVARSSASVGSDDGGGETVTVRFAPRHDAASGPLGRLDVRVTSRDGLVAAAVSLDEHADGFVIRLPLPPSARGQQLHVALGRNLPFAPIEHYAFHERQATHLTRRALDLSRSQAASARRRPAWAEALVPRPNEADRAWRAAGRADLADALGELRVQEPFVAEVAGRVLELRQDLPALQALPWEATPTTPVEVLSAARDLAWSLGDVETAALIERTRFVRTGTPELPLASHDALTLALAVSSPQDARELSLQLPY